MSTPTLAEDRQTLLTADGAGTNAKAAALARLEQAETTCAYVQAMLSCYTRNRETDMIRGAAHEAGLWPLSEKDREILVAGIGEGVVAHFETACGKDDSR